MVRAMMSDEGREGLPACSSLFQPVLDALKAFGSSGTPSQVCNQLVNRLNISDEALDATGACGRPLFRNRVERAHLYLSQYDYIRKSEEGVWSLTERGRKAAIDEAKAREIIAAVYPATIHLSDWETEKTPSVPPWAMVANVVASRPRKDPRSGERVWLSGTTHFAGGTKVLCGQRVGTGWHDESKMTVIGRARKSKRWTTLEIRIASLENFRVKQVHRPRLLCRLFESENKPRFRNLVQPGDEHRIYLEALADRCNRLSEEVMGKHLGDADGQ